jgi:hypothetical protein
LSRFKSLPDPALQFGPSLPVLCNATTYSGISILFVDTCKEVNVKKLRYKSKKQRV